MSQISPIHDCEVHLIGDNAADTSNPSFRASSLCSMFFPSAGIVDILYLCRSRPLSTNLCLDTMLFR
jgi:hypothetical protein